MKMKKSLLPFVIITMSIIVIDSLAQNKTMTQSKSKPSTSEPLRVVSGLMQENRINVRRSDWINEGRPLFEYVLASARLVDGKLEFVGSYRDPRRQKADVVTATLISTTARSANPWPNASTPTARDRRPANKQGDRGEVNEQTQSLYSAAEFGSGCELIYLRLQPPGQQAPLQVGVVLAHQDNEWGNQINQAVCRVVRAMNAKENVDQAVTKLTRSISRE